jgi:hypothetical protein
MIPCLDLALTCHHLKMKVVSQGCLASVGISLMDGFAVRKCPPGQKAILKQEVQNPFHANTLPKSTHTTNLNYTRNDAR